VTDGFIPNKAQSQRRQPDQGTTSERKHIMNTTHNAKTKLLTKAVGVAAAAGLSGGLALAGLGLAPGIAQAADLSDCEFGYNSQVNDAVWNC
jgi:hypothetical protein